VAQRLIEGYNASREKGPAEEHRGVAEDVLDEALYMISPVGARVLVAVLFRLHPWQETVRNHHIHKSTL